MKIIAFTSFAELAPYSESWDRLAEGVPFRSWAWNSCWWKHYQETGGELLVLGVFDEANRLIGIAPWHLARSAAKGRVLRWLGSGEVCSDYLSLLCLEQSADRVAEALADYLTGPECAAGPRAWDLLEISGVDSEDPAVTRLLDYLNERGCTGHENSPVQCWRLTLPASWDEYLAMVSKGHRKKLRRAERDLFQTGRAVLRIAGNVADLDRAMDVLIDLHQRRRRMLGEPGCFASPRFTAFHREVSRRMLAEGQLQLQWLELDGQTAAIEYQLTGRGVTYVYQAGIDPQRMDEEPGHLITAALIQRALRHGDRAVDFLRGDEPYKAHFRAEPRPLLEVRIVPNRAAAQLRNRLWLAGRQVKRWWKNAEGGMREEEVSS